MSSTKGTKEWAVKNVNFSKGCSNGCKYCYARRIANRFGWKKDNEWINMENKPSLANKRFQRYSGRIMSPSSHDITSKNVKLAIEVFKNILIPGNELLIVTKPKHSVIQELCEELEFWKAQIIFRFTIGTLNDNVRKYWEPFAPSIKQRLESLHYAYTKGWSTSVSIEPFLDRNLIKLIKTLTPFVTHTIWIGPMNKIHVPKELWSKKYGDLYSPQSLSDFKSQIDKLNIPKIRYKDHFLNIVEKDKTRRALPQEHKEIPIIASIQ